MLFSTNNTAYQVLRYIYIYIYQCFVKYSSFKGYFQRLRLKCAAGKIFFFSNVRSVFCVN